MTQHNDLFHALADLTGCLYISDLRRIPKSQLCAAVEQLNASEFPERQWIALLCYLTDQYQWTDPQVQAFTAAYAQSQLISYFSEYSEINA